MDIAAVLLGVLTLGFVAHQSLNLTSSLKSQVYNSIVTTQMEFDRLVLDRTDMYPFIYGDALLPDESTEFGIEVRLTIDLLLSTLDLTFQQRKQIPKAARPAWRDYARFVIERPAVLAYIRENPDWFPVVASIAPEDPENYGQPRNEG